MPLLCSTSSDLVQWHVERRLAQIFFDTVPFHGKRDFQIIRLLTKGARPERLDSPVMEEHIWNVIQRCWKSIPSERPTMEEIMATLTLAA